MDRWQYQMAAVAMVAAGVFLVSGCHRKDPISDEIERLRYGSTYQRVLAAERLGNSKDGRALKPLLDALKDDSADVRVSAANGLGVLGDASAIAPLLTLMEHDEFARVRRVASRALGKLGPPAVTPLMQCLRDKPRLRPLAAQALGAIGPAAMEPLLAAADDPDAQIRYAAITALGHAGNLSAAKTLVEHLDDVDNRVRVASARSLGQIHATEAYDHLLDRLSADDASLRAAAAGALGQLGDPRAIEPLIARLKKDLADGDDTVCSAAADALGELRASQAMPVLREYLAARDHAGRAAAVRAIANIGPDGAADIIAAALPDYDLLPDAWVALEKLGWRPRSDAEWVYYWSHRGELDRITDNWGLSEKVILADLASDDPNRVRHSMELAIRLGRVEYTSRLIAALERVGNVAMANACLQSGMMDLEVAATTWARRHGYEVQSRQIAASTVPAP